MFLTYNLTQNYSVVFKVAKSTIVQRTNLSLLDILGIFWFVTSRYVVAGNILWRSDSPAPGAVVWG